MRELSTGVRPTRSSRTLRTLFECSCVFGVEELVKGSLVGAEHPPEVWAAETTLRPAASLLHQGQQVPIVGPCPRQQLGKRCVAADATGDQHGSSVSGHQQLSSFHVPLFRLNAYRLTACPHGFVGRMSSSLTSARPGRVIECRIASATSAALRIFSGMAFNLGLSPRQPGVTEPGGMAIPPM